MEDIQSLLEQGYRHHKEGRHQQAEELYRRALRADPDNPDGLNLLATLTNETGRAQEAIKFMEKAALADPGNPHYHNNLGQLYKNCGRLDEAIESYRAALNAYPDFADAHNNLGNALTITERLDEAIDHYLRALEIDPNNARAHYNLGTTLFKQGNLPAAIESFQTVLGIAPGYTDAHNNLGNALRDLGRLGEAVASYSEALNLRPDYAEAHNNMGSALLDLGRPDEAVACYYEALTIKPDYAEAHCNLAEVFEKTNRTEALREAVATAKKNCPGHPRLSLGEAQLLKLDGDFNAAVAVLEAAGEEVADPRFLIEQAHLLGELYDRLGDTEAAYNHFKEGNRQCRDIPAAKLADGRGYLERIDVLTKRVTSDWIAGWRNLKSNDGRSDLVFLVGFPRSGTTLLDTILRSHPAISVVEERPTIDNVRNALVRLPGGDPNGLAELDPDHLAELRQIYFSELDKYREPDDRSGVVVDKMPLNTVEAALIHRIFPQARFLFVQRHPCDSVLSCFMQNFVPNNAMIHFLDLEDAAHLYNKVMTLWQQCQTVLPLAIHTVRYENLIEAFDETLSPLFDFLGVEWDDGVRNYAETAKRREKIQTTSYNQVTQPLYTRSLGRWERYREQMQPVLPLLLPWARHFGYGE